LQALASYTWSHSIDIASTDAFENYLNTLSSVSSPNMDRGDSDVDIRNAFTAGVTYVLPSPEANKFARATLGGCHPSFGSPTNNLTSPLFGQSTQTPASSLAGGVWCGLQPSLSDRRAAFGATCPQASILTELTGASGY
jgi:hypothetical protein